MVLGCSMVKQFSKEDKIDHILGLHMQSPYQKTGDHVARELKGFSLLDTNRQRVNSTSPRPCLKPKRIYVHTCSTMSMILLPKTVGNGSVIRP